MVAGSSTEAEYIAQTLATCEPLWTRKLMSFFDINSDKIVIHADNTGAIALAQLNKNTARTKHIDISYHLTRDCVQKGYIELQYISTKYMVGDCMTKPLQPFKLNEFVAAIGMQAIINTEGEC